MKQKIKYWIPLAVVSTLLCGVVYAAMQQNYRQSANDPQIQLSEDIAGALSLGQPAETLIPEGGFDISKSLAPFGMIFDASEKLIISSAKLGDQTLSVPVGVLAYAKAHGQNKVTWQPQKGVRAAIVATYYKNGENEGYVVVGRSLREVEKRVALLTTHVWLGWMGALASTFLVTLILF